MKEAARYFATGRRDVQRISRPELERIADDYEWMGAPAETVAKIRAEARGSMPDTGFAIHPANDRAVRLFLAMATQWRTASLNTMARATIVRTGLDYPAMEPTARMAGLALEDDDFARIRLMEGEALTAWREASEE